MTSIQVERFIPSYKKRNYKKPPKKPAFERLYLCKSESIRYMELSSQQINYLRKSAGMLWVGGVLVPTYSFWGGGGYLTTAQSNSSQNNNNTEGDSSAPTTGDAAAGGDASTGAIASL